MFWQQGDIILEAISELPENLIKHDGILAKGETTGHAHTVNLDSVDVFIDEDGSLYCKAKEEFAVSHQEHKSLKIPKGNYKVRKVLEYDHFAEEAREVKD